MEVRDYILVSWVHTRSVPMTDYLFVVFLPPSLFSRCIRLPSSFPSPLPPSLPLSFLPFPPSLLSLSPSFFILLSSPPFLLLPSLHTPSLLLSLHPFFLPPRPTGQHASEPHPISLTPATVTIVVHLWPVSPAKLHLPPPPWGSSPHASNANSPDLTKPNVLGRKYHSSIKFILSTPNDPAIILSISAGRENQCEAFIILQYHPLSPENSSPTAIPDAEPSHLWKVPVSSIKLNKASTFKSSCTYFTDPNQFSFARDSLKNCAT